MPAADIKPVAPPTFAGVVQRMRRQEDGTMLAEARQVLDAAQATQMSPLASRVDITELPARLPFELAEGAEPWENVFRRYQINEYQAEYLTNNLLFMQEVAEYRKWFEAGTMGAFDVRLRVAIETKIIPALIADATCASSEPQDRTRAAKTLLELQAAINERVKPKQQATSGMNATIQIILPSKAELDAEDLRRSLVIEHSDG